MLRLLSHQEEFLQIDHHVLIISQVLALQESHLHGEHRYNVAALLEPVKALLASLLVRTHRRRVTHRLHKEQVRRRVHQLLLLETMLVNRATAVQEDHDVKMKKEKWRKVAL
jgi:hypothetical protein